MRVLVTGGMGFIGQHTVAELLARGFDVLVLDRQCRPDTWATKASVMLGDIRDREVVFEAVQQCDAVINLAGILGTMETIDDPYPCVDTNIRGALNVFQACRKTRTRPDGVRGVQISVGNHFMNNSYAITKSVAERFAFMFNTEHGTKIALVRGLNAYGEKQKHLPVRKIVPNFVLRALTHQPIEIFGDGQQIMDMIYVKDLAKILVLAATTEHGCYNRVIDAGTGRRTTVNEIAELTAKLSGSTAGVRHLPMRAGEPDRSVVVGDPSTLRPLGISVGDLLRLEDGLGHTVAWYRKQVEQGAIRL
jgi:UDP-glucose 4-epimerase